MTSSRDRLFGAGTVVLGALAGATAGAVEVLNLLRKGDVRTAAWGAGTLAVAALLYAGAGALLVLPAWGFARLLPGTRDANPPPASAAVLGVLGGLAAFLVVPSSHPGTVLLLVLAATLAAVVLGPLRARLPRGQTLECWWAAFLAPSVLVLVALAWLEARGGVRASALALAGLGALSAGAALVVSRARILLALATSFLIAAGSALVAAPYATGTAPPPAPVAAHSVVLISVDTLRADHLGCYGDARARTPTMDALAAEGVCFENATSQANTTGPSHSTMLTGLYPHEHGAMSNGWPLADHARALPDLLRAEGFASAAFVSGFTMVDRACGLASRFDWYDDQLLRWTLLPQLVDHLRLMQCVLETARRQGYEVERADRPASETVDRALHWLRHRPDAEAPFFLFLHLYDPHAPYEPPPPFDALDEHGGGIVDWYRLPAAQREELVQDPAFLERQRALYAGEIAFVDRELGRLIGSLRDAGLLSRTLVVLTSDHGEGLGAHDYFFDHGTYLYDEELHVPLVLRFPDSRAAGTRVAAQVRLLDLAPTLLDALGVEAPGELRGQSLLPLLGRPDLSPALPSFALSELSGPAGSGERQSLRVDGKKLIRSSDRWLDSRRLPASFELYDLDSDPGETQNLLATPEPPLDVLAPLREQLENWHAALEHLSGRGHLSEEMLEQLRKLGYL